MSYMGAIAAGSRVTVTLALDAAASRPASVIAGFAPSGGGESEAEGMEVTPGSTNTLMLDIEASPAHRPISREIYMSKARSQEKIGDRDVVCTEPGGRRHSPFGLASRGDCVVACAVYSVRNDLGAHRGAHVRRIRWLAADWDCDATDGNHSSASAAKTISTLLDEDGTCPELGCRRGS